MKLLLKIFMLLVSGASDVSAQEKQDLKQLLKEKGPPAFTAIAADCRGHLLVCQGLEVFDPTKRKEAETLHGRVVLYCQPWDGLWLWAATVGLQMRQATPLLGEEKPGGKFSKELPSKKAQSCKLLKPARVWVGYIDKQGIVRLTFEVMVDELASK